MTPQELDDLANTCYEDHNGINTFDHIKYARLVEEETIKMFQYVGNVSGWEIDWLEGVSDYEAPTGASLYVRSEA